MSRNYTEDIAGCNAASVSSERATIFSEMERNRELLKDISGSVLGLKTMLGVANEAAQETEKNSPPENMAQDVMYQQCELRKIQRDLSAIHALLG